MMIWKLCRVFRLKEVYRRLPLLSPKNHISTTVFRGKFQMTADSEITRMVSLGRKTKKFRVNDEMPRNCDIIYCSTIPKVIIFAYHVSHILFLFIISGFFFFNQNELEYPLYEPEKDSDKSTKISVYSDLETYLMYSALLIYNVLTFLFCRRTVLRVWYNPQNNLYTLVLPKLASSKGRQVVIKPASLKVKYKYKGLSLVRSTHTMNGWTYYINPENFVIPKEYYRMIGKII